MKIKKTHILITALIFASCTKNPESMIEHLEGYWEIEEVTLADGTKREYNYNATIDFIMVTDSLTGSRKKLNPNFDGSFSTSNDSENFKIVIENDSLNLYYNTPYSQWKETILEASENRLLIINKDNLRYLYKPYEPLQLDE